MSHRHWILCLGELVYEPPAREVVLLYSFHYRYRPSAGLFPVIVSQDCGHLPTAQAIATYGSRVTHIKHPDLSEPVIPAERRKALKSSSALKGYFKISRHYKWALTQIFDEMGYENVIIVEGRIWQFTGVL